MALAKKRKRPKKHEEHVDESWLVPYADILTLLLALFIVLFASSSVDEKKLQQMSAIFNSVFSSGTGIMENPAVIQTPNGSESDLQTGASKYMEDQRRLLESQHRVDEFIAINELENQFETKMTDEGLLITIRDSVLFDMGRAELKAEYAAIADDLAQLLMFDPPRNIVITGHTDNVPISTAEFSSNWDLSVMRAVNFMKEIAGSNSDLDAKYFSVKGYGEFHPIASNDTEEGRAKNRRVEVLVQPRVTESGEMIVVE